MSKRVQTSQGSREGFFQGDGSDESSTMDSPKKATAAQLARRHIKPVKGLRKAGAAPSSTPSAPSTGQPSGNVFGSSLTFPPPSTGDSGQPNSQPSSFGGFGSNAGGGFNFSAPSTGFSFSASPSQNPFGNLNGASNSQNVSTPVGENSQKPPLFGGFGSNSNTSNSSTAAPSSAFSFSAPFANLNGAPSSQDVSTPANENSQKPALFGGFGSNNNTNNSNFAAPTSAFSFSAPSANLNGGSNDKQPSDAQSLGSTSTSTFGGFGKEGFKFSGFGSNTSFGQSTDESSVTDPKSSTSIESKANNANSTSTASANAPAFNLFASKAPTFTPNGSTANETPITSTSLQTGDKTAASTTQAFDGPVTGVSLFSQSAPSPKVDDAPKTSNLFAKIANPSKRDGQSSGSNLFSQSSSSSKVDDAPKTSNLFANIAIPSKPNSQSSGSNLFSQPAPSSKVDGTAQTPNLFAKTATPSKPDSQAAGSNIFSQSVNKPSGEAQTPSLFAKFAPKPDSQASGTNLFSQSVSSPKTDDTSQASNLFAKTSTPSKPDDQTSGSNIFSHLAKPGGDAKTPSIFTQTTPKPDGQASGSNLFSQATSTTKSGSEAQTSSLFAKSTTKPDTQASGSNIFSQSVKPSEPAKTSNLFTQTAPKSDGQASGPNLFSQPASTAKSSSEAQAPSLFDRITPRPDGQTSGSNIFSQSVKAGGDAKTPSIFTQTTPKPDGQASGSSLFSQPTSTTKSGGEAQTSNLFAKSTTKPDSSKASGSNISVAPSSPSTTNIFAKATSTASSEPSPQNSGTPKFNIFSQSALGQKPGSPAITDKPSESTPARTMDLMKTNGAGSIIPARLISLNTAFKEAVAAASVDSDLLQLVKSYEQRRQAILGQQPSGAFITNHVTPDTALSSPIGTLTKHKTDETLHAPSLNATKEPLTRSKPDESSTGTRNPPQSTLGSPFATSNKRKAEEEIHATSSSDADESHKRTKPNEYSNGVNTTTTSSFGNVFKISNKPNAEQDVNTSTGSDENPKRPMATTPGTNQAGENANNPAALVAAPPSSTGPPKFSMPKFAGSTANFAAFGKTADASVQKEKAKRKAEDFDSDEESEEQWERRDEEAQRAKKARLAEQSQGRTVKFVPGKGFVWEGERKDSSPDEQGDTKLTTQDAESQRTGAAEAAARPGLTAPLGPTSTDSTSESQSTQLTAPTNTSLAGAGLKAPSDQAGLSRSESETETALTPVSSFFGSGTASPAPLTDGAVSVFDSPRSEGTASIRNDNIFGHLSATKPDLEGGKVEELPDDADSGEEDNKTAEKPDSSVDGAGSALPRAPSQSPAAPSLFGSPSTTPKSSNLFGSPKSDHTWKPETPIKFGTGASPAAPTSIFGAASNVGFAFGGPPKPAESLLPSTEASRATTPGAATDTGAESAADSAADSGEAAVPEGPQANFSARGPGEEKEDVLFQVRAKAMMLATNDGKKEWENKGVGPCRVLKHQETGKARIVMRQDPSGTLVINAAVLNGVNYEYKSPKSVTFQTATADGKLNFWIVRVGKDSDATELAKVLESAK